MNTVLPWLQASRLPSQSYIFLPILAGQMFAIANGNTFNLKIFVLLQCYGLFMQLYIVYANDYADQATDTLNKTFTIFSGGSRVLVQRSLTSRSLAIAAWIMIIACLSIGAALSLFFNRTWAPLIIIAGILLLWMYSFKPVKLSYRGGGELLQLLGVGVILPLIGYYGQANTLTHFPFETMLVILPTQLACAIATSIPDYLSDVISSKRTVTVLSGKTNARFIIILLNGFSLGMFYSLDTVPVAHAPWLLWAGILMLLFLTTQLNNTEHKRSIFLFVVFSISLTLSIMVLLSLNYRIL